MSLTQHKNVGIFVHVILTVIFFELQNYHIIHKTRSSNEQHHVNIQRVSHLCLCWCRWKETLQEDSVGVLRSPPTSLGSFITLRAVEPDTFTSFIALQQTPHFSLIKPQGHTCAALKCFILFKSEIRKQRNSKSTLSSSWKSHTRWKKMTGLYSSFTAVMPFDKIFQSLCAIFYFRKSLNICCFPLHPTLYQFTKPNMPDSLVKLSTS